MLRMLTARRPPKFASLFDSAAYNISMGQSETMSSSNSIKRKLLQILLLLGIFAVPALLAAFLTHARMLQVGRETILWKWILDFSLSWYIWAALTPFIVWLGRRIRVERETWLRRSATHLAIGSVLGFVQVWLGVLFSIIVYQEPLNMQYWAEQALPTTFARFPSALLVYVVILGISYALDYQRQSHERAVMTSRLESELNRAKLDALKQQLQPHFLFNTLNSISVLMQKGAIDDATRVLYDLGELLRNVLRKENVQVVTLAEELDFVKRYVSIEQVRYGDRLKVEYEIGPAATKCLIPTFILQLLVENAIRHGVAKKADAGRITVKAQLEGDRLHVSVTDDGIGLSSGGFNEGVGISNARNRLQHLYGAYHRFEIKNNEGTAGVRAVLEIPDDSREIT